MSFADEPLLPLNDYDGPVESFHGQGDVATRIKSLIRGQPFGVLCTQGEGQPYGSLVALCDAG